MVSQKYAILYSGLSDYRHLNELDLMYRTLTEQCGFHGENILVLYFDGSLNYFGLPKPVRNYQCPVAGKDVKYSLPVSYRGTLADLKTVFELLREKLTSDDLLFIHTSGHGGGSEDPYDNKPSNLSDFQTFPPVKSQELATMLSSLPNYHSLVVMMSQCHSGGFVLPILSATSAINTHISVAAPFHRESVAQHEFSPFALSWISAWYHSSIQTPQQAFNLAERLKVPGDKPLSAARYSGDDMAIKFKR